MYENAMCRAPRIVHTTEGAKMPRKGQEEKCPNEEATAKATSKRVTWDQRSLGCHCVKSSRGRGGVGGEAWVGWGGFLSR